MPTPSDFCAVRRPAKTRSRPSKSSSRRTLLGLGERGQRRRRVRENASRARPARPSECELAEVGARAEDVRGAADLAVPRCTASPRTEAAAEPWKASRSPPISPPRARARRRGRGQLQDVRAPREARAERAAPEHARSCRRRRPVGARARRGGRAGVPKSARERPGDPADGKGPAASGSAAAVVTTSTACPRSCRKSASAGAWLAGPPTSGGQIPDTISTLTVATTSLAARADEPRLARA